MAFKMDMSKVKKVAHDKKCAILEHKDGHKITIALEKLSPKMREELENLPLHESKKMAEGGQVEELDPKKTKEFVKGATSSGWNPSGWVKNIKEGISGDSQPKKMADGGAIDSSKKTLGEIIGFPGSTPPKKMSDGGEVADNAQPQQESPQEPQQSAPQAPVTINIGQPQQAPAPQPPQESFAHQAGSALRNHIGERVDALKTIGGAVAAPVGDFVGGLSGTPVPQQAAPNQAPQMQPAMAQESPPVAGSSPQQPPVAASDPYGTQAYGEKYGAGLEQKTAGLQGEYEATSKQGKAEAEALQGQVVQQQEQAKSFQQHQTELESERQAVMHDIEAQHISPDNYWKDHSKLASAIGLIIGGFNPSNHSNGSSEFLQHMIDQNMEAQRAELGKKENLLSANLKQFGNVRDAAEMTRAMSNDIVVNKLKLAAAQASDPAAKARLLQQIGDLNMQSAGIVGQIAMKKTLLGGMASGQIPPERVVMAIVPKEQQAAAYKELTEAQGMVRAKDHALSAFDKLNEINTLGNRTISPIQTSKQVAAIKGPLVAQLSKETAGRFTEQDAKFLDALFPAVGDSAATSASKRQQLNQLISEKMNFPLLKTYGIDLGNAGGRFDRGGQSRILESAPVIPKK